MEAITFWQWTIDILLASGLLWLAWQVLTSPNLFRAIVLFISFGLLLALAWVRLEAPDVALAEAAIGTGLTGALLLAALAKLPASKNNENGQPVQKQKKSRRQPLRWLAAAIILPIAAGLGFVVLSLPPITAGLSLQVAANLSSSGVSNPVTAVLLNFRAYDTLLEMVVLLLALLGVFSLGEKAVHLETPPGPVLDSLTRLLVPILILVTAYLLWVGAHAPGGAFQAGSVLAGAGVLLLLTGWRLPARFSALPLRLALIAGVAVFVVMAFFTLLRQGQLLRYPPAQAGLFIFILELAATISIGITLAALYYGSRPPADQESP